MNRFWLIVQILIVFPLIVFSQEKTISGIVESKLNGERLTGANVYNFSKAKGVVSNNYGYFTIAVSLGDTLQLSYIGHEKQLFVVRDSAFGEVLTFKLAENTVLDAVDVFYEASDREVSQTGKISLPVSKITQLPVILSEPDVFKTLQLTPGVQAGTEGTSNIFVRGGDPGQNLVIIDDVPVYNTNHLLGFFSVVNSDVIKSCDIYKSGFPAKYGGRASSVIDLVLYDGNNKRLTGGGEIGILMGKFHIEGPISKEKSSFNVAVRRTFIDLFTYPVSQLSKGGGINYYFGDINAKANYTFSLTDRIYLNIYLGKDKAKMSEKNKTDVKQNVNSQSISWGNSIASLRWSHLFRKNSFMNTTLYFSGYDYKTQIKELFTSDEYSENFYYNYKSGIQDVGVRSDVEVPFMGNYYFKSGVSLVGHFFDSGSKTFQGSLVNTANDYFVPDSLVKNSFASESSLYFELGGSILHRLQFLFGVHSNLFLYENSKFSTIEPRAMVSYSLRRNFSVNASYTQMGQNIHLLTNATIGMPTDYWLPAQSHLLPEKASQYSVGASFNNSSYRISIDLYTKQMKNLIAYLDGVSFMENPVDNIDKIVSGNGSSKGIEFFVEKKKGTLTGWVSYTLSKTDREFASINAGKPFPFDYDRRHNFAVAGVYQLKKNVQLSAAWVYMSGFHITLPTQSIPVLTDLTGKNLEIIDYVDERNNFQTPAYHRLDVSIAFDKPKKKGIRTWRVGVYNAYNRQNPFYVSIVNGDYNEETGRTGNAYVQQESLFPIIPSISYAFKFY